MKNRKYVFIILFFLILLISSLFLVTINQKNKLESYIGATEAFLISKLDHITNDIIINGDKIITTQQEYNRIKKELTNLNSIISSHRQLELLSIYIDEHIVMEKVEEIKLEDLQKLRKFIPNYA